MITKLSLLFSAVLAGTNVEDSFDDLDFDNDVSNLDELEHSDEDASLDSLLEAMKGPNGENADDIAELKRLLAVSDESEESMAKLTQLFEKIFGHHAGGSDEHDQFDEAEL